MDDDGDSDDSTPFPHNPNFNFDEWEKELSTHPAFMTKEPGTSGGDMSLAFEALQAMKYDDDDDTAEQKARVHRDDGNRYFKVSKYRQAVDSYTEAIQQRCADRELNSVLFANRAAAHVRLGNTRSALRDCVLARKFNPYHEKALLRGAECLLKLELFAKAIEWCNSSVDVLLSRSPLAETTTRTVESLRNSQRTAEASKKAQDRDARRENARRQRVEAEQGKLVAALRERRVRLWDADDTEAVFGSAVPDLSVLDVELPAGAGDGTVPSQRITTRVRLSSEASDGAGHLIWPVLFVYPEYQQTDFVQALDETMSLESQLAEMFGEGNAPAWDVNRRYTPDVIEVFFENFGSSGLVRVGRSTPLGRVIGDERFRVKRGLPTFVVLSTASENFYADYLRQSGGCCGDV